MTIPPLLLLYFTSNMKLELGGNEETAALPMIVLVPVDDSCSKSSIVRRRQIIGRCTKNVSVSLKWNRYFMVSICISVIRCQAFCTTKNCNSLSFPTTSRSQSWQCKHSRLSFSRTTTPFQLMFNSIPPTSTIYSSSSSSRNVDYNVQAIYDYYDRRPWEVLWRLNCLGLPLLLWYIELSLDELFGISKDANIQRKRGAELRNHLVRSVSYAQGENSFT